MYTTHYTEGSFGKGQYGILLGTKSNIEYWYFTDSVERSLAFIVDPQGYLSQIQVKWKSTTNNSEAVRSISFSQMNEITELEAPEISEESLKNTEHLVAHHYHDGLYAFYEYDPEDQVYKYRCIGENLGAPNEPKLSLELWSTIPHAYRLLTEIDGIQVRAEHSILTTRGGMAEECLIIPKGMTFTYGHYNAGIGGSFYYLDKVFFEDTAENTKITVMDSTQYSAYEDKEIYLTLAEAEEKWGKIPYYTDDLLEKFYFAGEWEYVDGVPTPIG